MNSISLRISKIQDVLFYLNAPDVIKPEDIEVRVLGKEDSIDAQKKEVSFDIEITYIYKYDEMATKEILHYENLTSFYIENFEEVFKPKNGEHYICEPIVAERLIDVVLSTIRGILYVKAAGTGLSNFYLPLIDASEMVGQWNLE